MKHTKRALTVMSLAIVAILAGCAAGGTDSRMLSAAREMVTIDGFPIYVVVVPVASETALFDVEAGEGRLIAFAGVNEPLVYQARFRKAAIQELQRQFGTGARIRQVSEYSPTGIVKLFMRFEVHPA